VRPRGAAVSLIESKLAIRLALGGEKAESIGLSSTRVLPERLVDDGFEFGDADLETTLHRMLG